MRSKGQISFPKTINEICFIRNPIVSPNPEVKKDPKVIHSAVCDWVIVTGLLLGILSWVILFQLHLYMGDG